MQLAITRPQITPGNIPGNASPQTLPAIVAIISRLDPAGRPAVADKKRPASIKNRIDVNGILLELLTDF